LKKKSWQLYLHFACLSYGHKFSTPIHCTQGGSTSLLCCSIISKHNRWPSAHAELNALKKSKLCKKKAFQKISRATIYVVRFSCHLISSSSSSESKFTLSFVDSTPCLNCTQLMISLGIKQVVFSNASNQLEVTSPCEMLCRVKPSYGFKK
jgi:deoxycytidylate deaminase